MSDDKVVENEIKNPVEQHVRAAANAISPQLWGHEPLNARRKKNVDSVKHLKRESVERVAFHCLSTEDYGAKLRKIVIFVPR